MGIRVLVRDYTLVWTVVAVKAVSVVAGLSVLLAATLVSPNTVSNKNDCAIRRPTLI